jgi:flagellar biosynthesis protein FlgN
LKQTSASQLLAALTAEHGALLNFVALLEREQRMLVENLTDQLLELSEQKSTDALGLNGLAQARGALLEKNIPQLSVAPARGTPKVGNPLSAKADAELTPPPDARPSGGLGADAIHAWLGTHSPEGLAIWQKTLALAKRSQQLNRTNGELIQMKLRHNQQSLAVLSNAVNKANLYGPDGQPNFAPGSGRSLGSG